MDGLPLFHGANNNQHDSRFCVMQGRNASSSMCRGWSHTGQKGRKVRVWCEVLINKNSFSIQELKFWASLVSSQESKTSLGTKFKVWFLHETSTPTKTEVALPPSPSSLPLHHRKRPTLANPILESGIHEKSTSREVGPSGRISPTPQRNVPKLPRSVKELEQLVEQSERDGLANQLKNQSSTRPAEKVHPQQSLEEAAQHAPERSAKRRAVGEDMPTNQQDLACWMVSNQLELRDAPLMGEGVVPVASKGALRMEGCPSMVSNMVCWDGFFRFAERCAVGVACGSERLRTLARLIEPLQDTTQDSVRVDVSTGTRRGLSSSNHSTSKTPSRQERLCSTSSSSSSTSPTTTKYVGDRMVKPVVAQANQKKSKTK